MWLLNRKIEESRFGVTFAKSVKIVSELDKNINSKI